jgi:hypothetical protein
MNDKDQFEDVMLAKKKGASCVANTEGLLLL